MKMQFTPEQEATMRKVQEKEEQAEIQRKRRIERAIENEAKKLEIRLRKLHRLCGNMRLRQEIANFLAPYFHAGRYKAVGAFANQH